jgi:hypothetical protein
MRGLPTALLPGDGPAREVPSLDPDTDPTAIAQWVSLRRPTRVSKTDRPASAYRPTVRSGPNTRVGVVQGLCRAALGLCPATRHFW